MSVGRRPELLPMCGGLLAPTAWRNNALKVIETSNAIVDRSVKTVDLGKRCDVLPQLRGVVADCSNKEAHRYFRQVRLVVSFLQRIKNEIEWEATSLARTKEKMEKLHEHIRKDLLVNCQSKKIRATRPKLEKCKDGSDDLLDAEANQLKGLKTITEAHLKRIYNQIQALKTEDKKLRAVLVERESVLTLINRTLPCVVGQQEFSKTLNLPALNKTNNAKLTCLKREQDIFNWVDVTLFEPDPVGPHTPLCAETVADAKLALERSKVLREQADCIFQKTEKIIDEFRTTVGNSLQQRIAETVNMKEHLEIAYAENRYELNKAKKWYQEIERSMYLSKGCEMKKDLQTSEKLDRPIMKVLQRHPGNQMPDAQILCNADSTIYQTARNIGLLEIAGCNLEENIQDKKTAIRIDQAALKLRRSHASYKWAYNSQILCC